MSTPIRIGIAGYGNLGKGVETALARNPDMTLVGVFSRREPASIALRDPAVAVHPLDRAADFADAIDVMILCGGSKTDLPEQGPALAAAFNTVDSFGKVPARTCAIASSEGMVYCTPAFTPGTRRTASECPWLRPLPQNV